MEVNNVRFGNYTIGNPPQKNTKKKEEKAAESNSAKQTKNTKSANREDVLNAMDFIALQNKPQVNLNATKEINPSEFLSEDRISDIEAMMMEFETGVNKVADAIGQELPDLSEANKNALAARIFAQG